MHLKFSALLVAANGLVAFAAVLVFKVLLVAHSAFGAEGQTRPAATMARGLLCLGWDVVGSLLVALCAALVVAPLLRRNLRRAAINASMAIQAMNGVFLAISLEVAKTLGAPLEKSAIDLAFFNADPTGQAASSLDIWSSLRLYLTAGFAVEVLVAAVVPPLALRWLIPRIGDFTRSFKWLAAVGVGLFLTSAVVVPGLANGPHSVHTYGLERSPLPLLLASYLRAPLRSLTSAEPLPADPFCLDLHTPLAAPLSDNPLLKAHPRQTNLLVVFLESVNAQTLEVQPAPMPFLSALATQPATVGFAAHYTHWPQTMKALFTLFCSELPHPDYTPITYTNPAIPCVSLPQALKAHGFETALFTSTDVAYDRQIRFLKHRNFDRITDRFDMPGREGAWSNSWGIDEKVTVNAVLSWLRTRERGRPFFAIYNVATGHHPYEFPGYPARVGVSAEEEAADQRLALRYVDDRLRELMDGLRAQGLSENTLVAIVSDHGPGSGRPGMGRVRDASVYEGSVHVPFVITGPQLEGMTEQVIFTTGHIDVAPTLMGLLGLAPPITMKGRNLVRDSDGRAIIMGTRPPLSQIGVRAGPWKLVLWQETGVAELFDVAADPREQQDVSAQNAPVVAELTMLARAWPGHARNLIENYAAVLGKWARPCGRGGDK